MSGKWFLAEGAVFGCAIHVVLAHSPSDFSKSQHTPIMRQMQSGTVRFTSRLFRWPRRNVAKISHMEPPLVEVKSSGAERSILDSRYRGLRPLLISLLHLYKYQTPQHKLMSVVKLFLFIEKHLHPYRVAIPHERLRRDTYPTSTYAEEFGT